VSNNKSSRERLLQVSEELFRKNGYHNTSIADIAHACELRKASIYHHVSSKLDLGIEILRKNNRTFINDIFQIAYDSQYPALQRIQKLATALVTYFEDHPGGCLMGQYDARSV
jgi:AcrR family transcriptional regulator